ncbi:MAG TPA: hypothetical protein VGG74_11805 [Kofleriaceae bacterium]
MTVPSLLTISATNLDGAPSNMFLPIGSYYPSDLGVQLETSLNAYVPSGWTVSLSTGANGTLQWTINCSTTPFSIAWGSDPTLREVFGFTADIVNANAPVTGAQQGRGLWMPDCPLNLQTDPRMAPINSDLRQTSSPTGRVLGLVGNFMYVHVKAMWAAIPPSRIWEGLAAIPNASWEFFFNETQLGRGVSWFKPSSKLRITYHTGAAMGSLGAFGAGVDGWQIVGVQNVAPDLLQKDWTGLYSLTIPQLLSAGS